MVTINAHENVENTSVTCGDARTTDSTWLWWKYTRGSVEEYTSKSSNVDFIFISTNYTEVAKLKTIVVNNNNKKKKVSFKQYTHSGRNICLTVAQSEIFYIHEKTMCSTLIFRLAKDF